MTKPRNIAKMKGRASGDVPEAHVRLYRHELECPAYRTLSTNARALLIELRALYDVKRGDNRVFHGFRQMMQRCNLTQRAAKRARDELVEKGWITIVEPGGFSRKVRHSTVYALEHLPPNSGNGSQAGKAFMRWQPTTTTTTKKHGSRIAYRTVVESTTDARHETENKAVTVRKSTTDKAVSDPSTVVESTTQIYLPSEGGFSAAVGTLCFAQEGRMTTNAKPSPMR